MSTEKDKVPVAMLKGIHEITSWRVVTWKSKKKKVNKEVHLLCVGGTSTVRASILMMRSKEECQRLIYTLTAHMEEVWGDD